ncbi:MAG: ABC transporter ATP-binding protein/permease [Candidatus Omnitrophica bacterium]|nr:ABC transporter ATP-binding protein/permease [Candidatus Omnitrophota bacterium]
MKLFFRFLSLVRPYWKKYALILCLGVLSGLLTLLNPYLTRWVVDGAITGKNFRLLLLLGSAVAAVFVCESAVTAWRRFLDRQVQLKLGFDLARKVMRKIVSLSPLELREESSSRHLYRISYEADRVNGFLASTIPDAAYIFPKFLLTVVILFSLNAKIAGLVFLLPVLYIPTFWINRKVQFLWDVLLEHYHSVFRAAAECFSNLQVIKAFGTEGNAVRRYVRKYIQMMRSEMKKFRWQTASEISVQAVMKAVFGVAAVWGGYQIICGELTLGAFASILVYLSQLAALKGRIVDFFHHIAVGLVSCERVATLLDKRPMVVERPDARDITLENPDIVFEQVSFGYLPEEPVLSHVSLRIPACSHIAVVGPSGCGKTTLIGLLLRMADPWAGKILLGGVDLRDFTLHSIKSQIAIALQESFLWDDTVENNIRYGNLKASAEDVIWAARVADITSFSGEVFEHRRQNVGEKARKLSEGQKQKIAIARALIRRPRILILDEAMSSIDSASEMKILEAIRASDPSLLIVTVSHRLSAVMKADLVYYLKRPDEIVSAPPREMIRIDPDFTRLFTGQVLTEAHLIRC